MLSTITMFTATQAARANGIRAPLVQVLAPVLDDSWFSNVSQAVTAGQPPEDPPELLTVARLDADEGQKGVDRMLRALASPGLRNLPWNYRVVGDGTDRPRLQELADDLGIGDRVEFVGAVSDEQLHAYFSRCQLFALPSTQEGFGIVFLEAAAYGKPVIGTTSGGIPEVVLHGQTGILADAADDGALVAAVALLVGDGERREVLGSAGRSRVQQYFRPANFRLQLADVLGSPSPATDSGALTE